MCCVAGEGVLAVSIHTHGIVLDALYHDPKDGKIRVRFDKILDAGTTIPRVKINDIVEAVV